MAGIGSTYSGREGSVATASGTAIEQVRERAAERREADLELLRKFAAGDGDAFGLIVQRYVGVVYSTSLRIVGDGARAEDVSQETFFGLMRRPHDVHQNLGAWLHRTATHLALDSIRSDTSRRKREITYTRECKREASSWAELSPSVDQAISELPEEMRTLLVSHYLLGRSQAELAGEMGQSAATVSRRMQKSLDELRVPLAVEGDLRVVRGLSGAAVPCCGTAGAGKSEQGIGEDADGGGDVYEGGDFAGDEESIWGAVGWRSRWWGWRWSG